jgi:hypothetical protein
MVAWPVLVMSACEVAVTVTLDGSPVAIVGAVYAPVESMDPQGLGLAVQDTELLSDQATEVLVEFVTVAVNEAVCGGQLSAESFGNKVDPEGLTLTVIAGGVLLPPPQASSKPRSASETKRLATMEYLDRLRPAMPTMTTPASGRVIGSQGMRLSAWRCCFLTPPFGFGPVVVMVRVSVTGLAVPAGIGFSEKLQVTVASGRPLQTKLTAAAKVVTPVPVAVTVKVEVVDCPESTVPGLLGFDKVNVGALTTCVTMLDVLPELFESPP